MLRISRRLLRCGLGIERFLGRLSDGQGLACTPVCIHFFPLTMPHSRSCPWPTLLADRPRHERPHPYMPMQSLQVLPLPLPATCPVADRPRHERPRVPGRRGAADCAAGCLLRQGVRDVRGRGEEWAAGSPCPNPVS